jgi:hypothetical protein
MSAVALFVSLGGVSYAATKIGSAQITDNSVRSRDIRDRTIAAKDIRPSTIASLRGQTGPAGPKGDAGPRGPSDVFEAVQNNSFVLGNAGGKLGIELILPPGTYVIHGKVAIAPVSDKTPTFDSGQCTLAAGTVEDRAIDDWDPGEHIFKTLDMQLTQTLDATVSVTMRCFFMSEDFRMGTGAIDDTRIVAVRVDKRTTTKVAIG